MYRVVWRRPALDRMAEIVRQNPDRKDEFADALRSLAAAFAGNAAAVGEEREPPYRVWFFGPLTVNFRPAPSEQAVYSTEVRLHVDD
jgi:hypothetical protein